MTVRARLIIKAAADQVTCSALASLCSPHEGVPLQIINDISTGISNQLSFQREVLTADSLGKHIALAQEKFLNLALNYIQSIIEGDQFKDASSSVVNIPIHIFFHVSACCRIVQLEAGQSLCA
jgi:hypothetical protein